MYTAVAKLLLERGADPNAGVSRPMGNWQPQHVAAEFGHAEIVDLLLKYGANPRVSAVPLFTGAAAGQIALTLAEKFEHDKIAEKLKRIKADQLDRIPST